MQTHNAPVELTAAEVAALPGLTLLEFGTRWCGYCARAQPELARALQDPPPGLVHLKVEDGRSRPLGRAFGVKLWPTFVLLRDGQEAARVVRPAGWQAISALWAPQPGLRSA